jgi:thioredoxin 1
MLVMPQDRVTALLAAVVAIGALACEGKARTASAPSDDARSAAAGEKTASSAERPMMIEFSRDYCTPCQVMKPWVEEIADENPKVDVLTLNVDRKKYEHIGSFFKVTAVPSLIFLDADGQVVRRSDGLAKKEQMTRAFAELGWAQ